MPYILFIVIGIICPQWLNAQQDYSKNSPYRNLQEGQSYVILNDQTSLHAVPSDKGAVIESLPVGQAIWVLERMDETLKVKGFETNWYRVSVKRNEQEIEGFLWGGNIALSTQKRGQVYFAYGIDQLKLTDRGDYKEDVIHIKIVAYANQLLLDQATFSVLGTLYTQSAFSVKGAQGLPNVEATLQLSLSDAYCGGVAANITLFWNEQKLYYIDMLPNGFGDQRFESKYFIYPNDEQGKENKLILREEAGNIDAQKQIHYEYQRETYFSWTGKQLIQIN